MTGGLARIVEDMTTFFTTALKGGGVKIEEAKKTEGGAYESNFKCGLLLFEQLSQYVAQFRHVDRFGNIVFYKQFILLI